MTEKKKVQNSKKKKKEMEVSKAKKQENKKQGRSKYVDDDKSDVDLQEIQGHALPNELSPSQQARKDSCCAKLCFILWYSVPAIIQLTCLYGFEMVGYYIVGRTGDYGYIDI